MKFINFFIAALFVLPPVASYAQDKIEEVIVISSLTEMSIREVATSVTVVDENEIDLRGYSSVTEILRTQPGIAVSSQGGQGNVTALRIRGEEAFRTRIMIDGVDISDTASPQVAPRPQHLLAGNSLQRVEILRGPQGFIYGADAGGVINIITRSGNDGAEGKFSAESGSFDSRSFSGALGYGSDTGDIFIALDDFKTDGFNARPSDITADDDGYENTTGHFKLGLQNDVVRGQLVVRDVDAKNEFDGCFDNSTSARVDECEGSFKQTLGKLTLDFKSGILTNSFAYSESTTDSEIFASKKPSFGSHGKVNTVDYLSKLKIDMKKSLLLGVQKRTEEMDAEAQPLSREQDAGFVEWQSEHFSRLFITAGARYDDNEDFGHHKSVRTSVAYLLPVGQGKELKFRSSYGTGFRPPSLFEVENSDPSPLDQSDDAIGLQEEKSRGVDLGVDYYVNNSSLSLTLFRQAIVNQIEWQNDFDHPNFGYYVQALGESVSKGVELSYDMPISQRWGVQGNITYNDATTPEDKQRIRRPKWLANIGLSLSFMEDTLNVLANMRSSQDAKDIGGQELDDYTVVDISARYILASNWQANLRIENLADDDYQEVTDFNTPGRTVNAGLTFQF